MDMDDGVNRAVRRPGLKERLLGCCGAKWGLGPTIVSLRHDGGPPPEGTGSPIIAVISSGQNPIENGPNPPCAVQRQATTGMNLGAALAAERQMRAALDSDNGGTDGAPIDPSPGRPNSNGEGSPTAGTAPETPARVSLMRLLAEADGFDWEMWKEEDGEGCGSVCCVCMGRKKGAAFIPCGHTFCRVCSRELWLNRRSCPLCNRPILEILDIY
ncbi:hypothetical protein OROMI_022509 [Orobanche minor]